MPLTTETVSFHRKEKRISALLLTFIFLILMGAIYLGIYAYQEDHTFKSKQLSYAIVKDADYTVPRDWLYLAAVDAPDIAPGGNYWIPMLAASKNAQGDYLVACLQMDITLMHGKYPRSQKISKPYVSIVPKSLIEEMATDPASPYIGEVLAKLPCGNGRMSKSNFYDTDLAGQISAWREGSRNFQQTAKTLLKETR